MKKDSVYTPTIGIECHVQLKTKTKLFAAVGNDARNAEPNSLVSHICLGMPGALPVLNRGAVDKAVRAAFALNTTPEKLSFFERKHYNYPDLPKGYQITQLKKPIVVGGSVEINVEGTQKTVRINRVQLEEDAGKNTHPSGKNYSLVDLNRAGTPLLEIVSEPDIQSASEAKAYARELYLLMKYADISDADLYHGNMRFDVNVSVSNDPKSFGTRTETKNLNSFKSVEKAAEYEIKRQIELLEKGQKIVQETRGWDDAKQKTLSQRTKEESHDYRYMPDPDIPPVVLDDKVVSTKPSDFPVLPKEWREILKKLELDELHIENLLDAEVEFEGINFLPLIHQHLEDLDFAKFLANWNVNILIPVIREGKLKLSSSDHLRLERSIYELINADKLSSTNAKKIFVELLESKSLPTSVEDYASKKGYIQVSDSGEIQSIVDTVINANPQAATDVRNGEMKAIGFLVGQVMKESKGKANPAIVQKIIREKLGG